MNRLLALLSLLTLGVLVGCGPKEPEAPAVPEKSVAEQRRENWFGAKLAAEPGITWRESGLGIKVLKEGEGALIQRMDKVRVHYVGRLIDGTEFDSSLARGKPNDFRVADLINGWAAAMTTMRPGGKALFYIPPHLGYGGLRAGKIPPNSAIIFEVDVLAVNPEK